MATPKTESEPKSQQLAVELLEFDKRNPRFPSEVSDGSVNDLLEKFVRDERLLEIIESIGGQGFFPGEPLLVVKKARGTGYVVVEGNRRLAALKLLNGLLNVPEGRPSIERACNDAVHRPKKVQCLIFEKEDQILRYLGFRHITGIKSWSALQKARYLERLFSQYERLPHEEGLRQLARDTGSKAPYMGQMLTSLALYTKAEAKNFFKLGISPDDIDFSILSTALSYSSIVEFLGIESRKAMQLSGLDEKNLAMLFKWLFQATGNQKSIVGESRNLKKLATIVSSSTAVSELNKSGSLDEAFELSKGPSQALTDLLSLLQKRLSRTLSFVPKVSEIEESHNAQAEEIEAIAAALFASINSGMKRRSSRGRASSKRISRNA